MKERTLLYLLLALISLNIFLFLGWQFQAREKTPQNTQEKEIKKPPGYEYNSLFDINRKKIDLGVKEISSGRGEIRFSISGIISGGLEEKDGMFWFPLILSFDENDQPVGKVKVLLGEKERKIGFSLAPNGSEKGSWNTKQVEEISEYIIPNNQVYFETIIGYEPEKEKEYRQSPKCDSACLEKIDFTNRYGFLSRKVLEVAVKEDFSFENIEEKIIGPVSQILLRD